MPHPKRFFWRTWSAIRKMYDRFDGRLKPYYCPWQQRNNHGMFAVNIQAEVGFFAQLNWCVYIFAHCERFGLNPVITLTSPFYTRKRGDDWLSYFFDSAWVMADGDAPGERRLRVSQISTIGQLGLPDNYGVQMTLENANRLFTKNLRLKQEIDSYIHGFMSDHFCGRRVLGVHFRGTDKALEAPPVTFDDVAENVDKYLAANPGIEALFVASDEQAFVDCMRKVFDHIDVISHEDSLRSSDGTAIHTRVGRVDNYLKGREALVNCLLLSRCDALIRTASFLSAWSSVFNPGLPVIMLNRPYDDKTWFPDSVIVNSAAVAARGSRHSVEA